METTTISIRKSTRDLLDVCGSRKETFADIVDKVTKEYIEVRK